MNHKCLIVSLVLIFSILIMHPVDTLALSNNDNLGTYKVKHSLAKNDIDCGTLLGSTKNKDSFAWLVQEIFNIIKYAGPFLLLILSSIDFAKTIIQSDEESMHKAQKRLLIRIILVLALFFIPDLVMVIMGIFGLVSTDPTCGIE